MLQRTSFAAVALLAMAACTTTQPPASEVSTPEPTTAQASHQEANIPVTSARSESGSTISEKRSVTEELKGLTYIRGNKLPSQIGDGWRPFFSITPARPGKFDFWVLDKNGENYLISAQQESRQGGGQFRYGVKDVLIVPALTDTTLFGRCANPITGPQSEFALIDMTGARNITWLAGMSKDGSLSTVPRRNGQQHKCTFLIGEKPWTKILNW
ncbi:hypothetical protein [Chitinivorax sp. B]|uniref:hypothetical protein n=1 Tax=Chitinivorax sp. B TaxID=2502235 RepID=UPI0010F9BEA2|nr:hypothetical protein [Chitinivorax sp. B]